jgi:CRP/FNR family transcriptional regulator
MKIVDLLKQVPLFQGLPQEQIEELANLIVVQELKRAQTIFSEGDEGTGFYVVISGRVKVFKLSLEGKEQILHIFGPGEPFGEVPVFAGENFPAHAEALEKSRIFFLDRQDFVNLIQREPSLAMNMLAVLSKRLRQFTRLIEDLSLKEVPGRLAAYLLYLSTRQGGTDDLELDIPKGQLASILGTIPETLSRILGKMSQIGLIQVQGRQIKIKNRNGLEELAAEGKLL